MFDQLRNKPTINDRLSALDAYVKTKAFGWALVLTGLFIVPGRPLQR